MDIENGALENVDKEPNRDDVCPKCGSTSSRLIDPVHSRAAGRRPYCTCNKCGANFYWNPKLSIRDILLFILYALLAFPIGFSLLANAIFLNTPARPDPFFIASGLFFVAVGLFFLFLIYVAVFVPSKTVVGFIPTVPDDGGQPSIELREWLKARSSKVSKAKRLAKRAIGKTLFGLGRAAESQGPAMNSYNSTRSYGTAPPLIASIFFGFFGYIVGSIGRGLNATPLTPACLAPARDGSTSNRAG